ncbi:unnamed protein product [Amoebophrya sp. A25]|nr:unnamed protein product [Amoebophrya sp. A25]|eukprot:GSA25T00026039001.1
MSSDGSTLASQVREATRLALEEEDLKGGSGILRSLVKEKKISATQQRQILAAWADGNGVTFSSAGHVVVSPAEEVLGTAGGASSSTALALAGDHVKNQSEADASKASDLLVVGTTAAACSSGGGQGGTVLPCEAEAPSRPLTEAEIAKRERDLFEQELLLDAQEMTKEQKQRRKVEKEKLVSEVMRKQKKSRREAMEYITQGGLDAEKMQGEMGAPNDAYWDEVLKKGPPEWFEKAFAEYEAKMEVEKEGKGIEGEGSGDGVQGEGLEVALTN